MEMTRHSDELTSLNLRPINPAPYCAGPEAREFEKMEIDKMSLTNGIDAEGSELASSIVFAPYNDGFIRFSSD